MGVWIETAITLLYSFFPNVTPYVGVWIETRLHGWPRKRTESHSLCGSVDWNLYGDKKVRVVGVTPYVGVWIETPEYLTG